MGLAVGLSGVAFGAAAVTAGLTVPQACVLSLLAFTGASQFAFAGAVGGRAATWSRPRRARCCSAPGTRCTGCAWPTCCGCAEHASWAPRRGVIGETTAVALAQPTPEAARAGFFTTFAAVYVGWNVTTLLGAIGTSSLGDPGMLGLDVVGPATFLAILWPRLKERAELRALAAGGMAIALAATPFFPPGVPVLLAAVAVLVVMLR
ncbi:AzlC family ABC transporter permease [Nonomuraea ferruginea]